MAGKVLSDPAWDIAKGIDMTEWGAIQYEGSHNHHCYFLGVT
jgi:hypothetical protein